MWLQEIVVDLLGRWPATHQFLLVPGIEPLRWALGRRRAHRTFERSARLVPAYRRFLAERGASPAAFDALPETDKSSYIARFSIPERCVGGRLPRRGVVVDESGGRMAWMLFRYGTGKPPPRAWRRSLDAMLLDTDATAVAS